MVKPACTRSEAARNASCAILLIPILGLRSTTMARTILLLLAGALALGSGGAALAADVTVTVYVRDGYHRHHRHRHVVPAWAPPSGQQIYYSHYPEHIPAYSDHVQEGVPVPVFPMARPPRIGGSVPTIPHAHIDRCAARYASYRLWDNTWQPYHGPRRQCLSPYR
jgi:hypothetical protein